MLQQNKTDIDKATHRKDTLDLQIDPYIVWANVEYNRVRTKSVAMAGELSIDEVMLALRWLCRPDSEFELAIAEVDKIELAFRQKKVKFTDLRDFNDGAVAETVDGLSQVSRNRLLRAIEVLCFPDIASPRSRVSSTRLERTFSKALRIGQPPVHVDVGHFLLEEVEEEKVDIGNGTPLAIPMPKPDLMDMVYLYSEPLVEDKAGRLIKTVLLDLSSDVRYV